MKPETLSLRQLNRATLARQMLFERANVSVAEAVERLAGMQAQEPGPPFIGLWSRLAGFRHEELRAALHERALVRATMMRGTLHLLSAADYVAFRALFEPMLTKALTVLGDRAEGLDAEAVLPVARVLLAERPHTFTEMRARLQGSFPDVHERALGFCVRMLLPLVMVPTTDRHGFPFDAAFTLSADWLGRPHDPSGSPLDLVRRYLAAFGPATMADFQEWSGLLGAKLLFETLRPDLRIFRSEKGRELFDVPDGPLPDADVPVPARFLPEFDNLLLAHADRSRIVADAYRKGLVTKNLRVRATFLWDGFAAGFWTITRKRDTATLELTTFEPLSDAAGAALTEEGMALLHFLEPEVPKRDIVWKNAEM